MTPPQRKPIRWGAGGLGLSLAGGAVLLWLRRSPDPSLAAEMMPTRGDYWFAEVPFADDPTKSKDRPVLVLGVTRNRVHALKVSSQDKSAHHGWIPVDPSS